MATKSHFGLGFFSSSICYSPFLQPCPPASSSSFHLAYAASKKSFCVGVLRSPLPGSEVAGDKILQIYVKDREKNGDFISKVYDYLWRKDELKFVDAEFGMAGNEIQQIDMLEGDEMESNGGFLKLSETKELVSGENIAPTNKRLAIKKWKDESDKRRKVNFLKYQALKGELLLLTIGVGVASDLYCLIILSAEAAISYAAGVLFSYLYLQLLYHHTDSLSVDSVPEIFLQKKSRKIGIRSEDLKIMVDKTLNGISMALSSPRLMIPAAIYGLWALSHEFLDIFDFQLVPAMIGFLAYKAAALIQVYRDNESLRMVFPENEEN